MSSLATWAGAGGLLGALALCRWIASGAGLPRTERVQTHGDSRWAKRREVDRLGHRARPHEMRPNGLVLGFTGSRVLQTRPEDNLLVFGVQRSGKTTTIAVPTLLAWRGAVVATSVKHELARLTAPFRRRLGPVYAFAPLEPGVDWPGLGLEPVAWNPVRDVETAHEALQLAHLFTSEGKQGQSAHWYHSASSLIAGLVLAEAGDLRSVLSTLNRLPQSEYQGLALRQRDPAAQELLSAHAQTPEREAGSIASTARSSLSLWMDDRVARATSSAAPNQLDVEGLLADGATLYLIAPAEEAERCRPLFSALLQTILRKAIARARRQQDLLNPRLLLALDEVANFARIPHLASHVSTGPGQGIQWLLCFHDLAQLEQGYGYEQARTVWNNCRARLLLPGQGDLKTLEQFSKAIGDETRVYQLDSTSGVGRSRSEHRVGRPLAAPDDLRRLARPLLLYADQPPARLVSRRWDQVPAWRELIEGGLPLSKPDRAGQGGSP